MRAPTTSLAAFATAVALGLLAAARQAEKDEAVTPAQAGALFRERCASCHVAPDASFATDRAWLEQVHDTA